MGPRVVVGGFSMEANTFAAGETSLDDLRAQMFGVGDALTPTFLGEGSELAGGWTALADAGATVVPSFAAWSGPGRPLAPGVLDELTRLLLEPVDDTVDGVYLMLHGACVARDEDDPEGAILERLRERLGSSKRIVVSLDCHANLTPRMVGAVDGITAYRTCPHVDTYRTGEQAGRLLARTLAGEVDPVIGVAERPMVTPPELHDSSRDPFRRLMALNDAVEAQGALASALLPVQPWVDVPGLGWKAVVTGDGDPEAARRWAERIMDEAWAERRTFLSGRRLPVDDALAEALAQRSPVVVADAGDATNGGTVGDSTELLRAALEAGAGRVLLSIRDAGAAERATAAGEGAEIGVLLGAGAPGTYCEATPVRARVLRLFDGEVVYTHPVNRGYRAATGPAALLRVDGVDVVVHSRSVGVIDPALYEALGADPSAYDVLQAKSHISFKAGFEHVTERSVVADTPGPSSCNLPSLPYVKRPAPLFPFEDFEL
ncbi:MAG TPA: M81 family metallopeptidase [Gaiellaceae bacterium]|nr:M81 family metallopeptidase [Gaiellaceae bacterium]